MKRFFQLALLVLVLATVALISALTAMRLAIHRREVSVPKLVGLTPSEAERVALSNGLPMDLESKFYSSEVPEGRIVYQYPPPGTRVRRGWRLRVAESLGPQRAVIPDVVGQSGRAAEINIRRRGLDVGTIALAHIPNLPADQVVAQSPPPAASGLASPKINLLVTLPQEAQAYVMPSFVGRHLAEAAKVIEEAGMRLGNVSEVPAAGVLPSTILRQAPAPGQQVTPGTVVSFEVAK